MIKLTNVSKKIFNKSILSEINLDIRGVFGILGQNGAGKTTLLNLIATATDITSGEIKYKGISWTRKDEVRKLIGYLPQSFSMYDKLTIYESLEYLAFLKGLKLPKDNLERVLLSVNLLAQKNKKVKEISGGMLRRLGIGQALLGEPKILIVDEPTTGLDIKERIRFRNLLKVLGKSKIVIISSHIVEDVEMICDRYAILKNGSILLQGTKEEIISAVEPRVWEIITEKEKLEEYLESYYVISYSKINGRYKVRFLHDKPTDNATQVKPTLEDSYLYLSL